MEGAGLQSSPSDKTVKGSCKYLTVSLGQILKCHTDIQNYLRKRRPELEESINYKDYDAILAFCYIDPQLSLNDREESIATFLAYLPGSKPVALVVLHQTPENIVSDIGGDLPRRNMVKIDYLFQENEELQQCPHNETSLNKVADWLLSEVRTEKSRKPPPPIPPETVNVFSLVTGNTLGSHKQFVGTLCERRAGIQEVSTVQECDVILCFCPVVSKVRTDIKAALQNLNDIPVTKDVVLVVLHHTFDPECTVPDSSRSVSRENTLTVDCLFHEDRGILLCNRNEEAFRTVFKLIDTKIKEKKPEIKNSKPLSPVVLHQKPDPEHVVPDISGDLPIRNMGKVEYLPQENKELQQCTKNESSLNKAADWFIPKVRTEKSKQHPDPCTTVKLFKQPLQKYLIIRPGRILRCHKNIMQSLQKQRPELQEVFTAEECDVVLAFCCIYPQGGSDIEETMNLLASLPDSKPVALVVLHQSFNPEHIPDISVFFTRENMLEVDFLFQENEELLQCTKNEASLKKVEHWLISEMKKKKPEIKNAAPCTTEKFKQPLHKYLIIRPGRTLRCHEDIMQSLQKHKPELQEVLIAEECDVILAFCHIIPQCGNDIEETVTLLASLPDSKPVVLVVLHQTYQPEHLLPDISGTLTRGNIIKVNFLFYENEELLQSTENESSLCNIAHFLIPEGLMSPDNIAVSKEISTQRLPQMNNKSVKVKVFSCVTGNTLGSHKQFVGALCSRRAGIQEVSTVEECDIILCFCPIVSKARTDIEAALQKLNDIPVTKDVVLVVLHKTFNPEYTVPDSSRSVSRKNTLTVDCLFYEDHGILHCSQNEEAFRTVFKLMDTKGRCWSRANLETPDIWSNLLGRASKENLRMKEKWNKFSSSKAVILPGLPQKKFIKVFSLVTGKTLGFDKDFVKTLCDRRAGLQEVSIVEECDVILCFCPVVSQAVVDIEKSLRKLNNETQGSHPVVLVVLHHTFDAESIVLDSSKSVARKNTLTVDCLFFEDRGILSCSKNEEAYCRVLAWIESQDDTQLNRFKNDSFNEEGGCGQM